MMKKLLVLLLSAMMVFSLVACGGDDTTTGGDDQQVENEVDANDDVADDATDEEVVDDATEEDLYYVSIDLDAQEAYELPDSLANTSWIFAGGFVENVEMDEDAFLAVLEEYNGQFDLVFGADDTVQMVVGGEAIEGTYTYSEDNDGVILEFDDGETYFYCVYTEVDNVSALVAFTDDTLTNAFYFLYE